MKSLNTAMVSANLALKRFQATSIFSEFQAPSVDLAEVKFSASIPETLVNDFQLEKKEEVESDLFDAAPLLEYLRILDEVQKITDDENAKKILTDLIKKYPHYPDAHVKLGDLFKTDNHKLAFKYYSTALEKCPFDRDTQLKLTSLIKQFPDLAINDKKQLTLEQCFLNRKEFKLREKVFKYHHQEALNHQLITLRINDGTPLTADDTFDFDVDITNGAAKDVFYGLIAHNCKLLTTARYYLEKALIKCEHDYVAKTVLAFTYVELKKPKKALSELVKIAKKYHYVGTYFRIYKIYRALEYYELARHHLMAFLNISQQDDLDKILDLREDLTEFLQYNIFDEAEVKKYKVPIRYDLKAVLNSPTSLGITFIEMMKQVPKFFNPDALIELNEKILQYPYVSSMYHARALFYTGTRNMNDAVLDFTMAIWYEKELKTRVEYYFGRCGAHLNNGNIMHAEMDFNHLDKSLTDNSFQSQPDLSVTRLYEWMGKNCLATGDIFVQQNNYVVADNLYQLGIMIKPGLELYLGRCKTMENLNKSPQEIAAMLKDGDVKAKLKDKEATKFFMVYNKYKTKIVIDDEPEKVILVNPPLKEDKTEETQKRRKKKKPTKSSSPLTPAISTPKKSSIAHIKTLLAAESPMIEIIDETKPTEEEVEQQRREKLLKDAEIKQARKAKKNEEKRQLKIQRRLTRPTLSNSNRLSDLDESKPEEPDDISGIEYNTISSITEEISHVKMNDLEKQLFALITDLLTEEEQTKYKTYLVGGWAYDKVRQEMLGIPPCPYNDADFTTEIPPTTLAKKFTEIAEVQGLFIAKLGNVKIDIVYQPDLSNLLRDVKGRDFLTFYIDRFGKVTEPTGFGFTNLRHKRLSGVNPPADMFKDDPLLILRGIYQKSKRDLNINSVKQIISTDRHLLIPRTIHSNSFEERLFTPRRFNLRITKLFTQKLAAESFQLLKKLKILEVLFPTIYSEIQYNHAWLKSQMDITNTIVWPKIQIIYANFITCAVVMRVPEYELAYLPEQIGPSHFNLANTIRNIWHESLLFSDAFESPTELYFYLRRPLDEWKIYSAMIRQPQIESANSLRM